MNKTIRILLLSAAAASACQAAPFMAVGDSAELFATGVLGVRADDNILLAPSSQRESDIIFDIAPGLELDYGKNAQLQGSLTIADAFARYTDHSRFNTQLFSGDFVSKYDDGKMKLGFDAGYHELNQNTVDVRGLIRRDVGNIDTNAEVTVSELTSVGVALNYLHENYHPTNFVDDDTLAVPLKFYYKWTPKVDLSLGYTYSNYDAKNGLAPNSRDHFFNVGARGEFTPKLTGSFAVGYTERNTSGFGNRSLLGLDSSFAFELTPKSTLQLGATNQFGTSPQGLQQKNFTVNLLDTTKLTEEFSVNAGVSYRRIGYDTRSDDYWEATIGGAYVVNANVRLVAAYVYRTYNTDLTGSDFTNNVFSVAANLRY